MWKQLNQKTRNLGYITLAVTLIILFQVANFKNIYPGYCDLVPDKKCFGFLFIGIQIIVLVFFLIAFGIALSKNVQAIKGKKPENIDMVRVIAWAVLITFFIGVVLKIFLFNN